MVALVLFLLGVAAAGPLAAWDLLVDHVPSPIGVDNPNPYFQWTVGHTDRAQSQRSYRVEVSSSSSFSSLVWDSGTVVSNLTKARYGGSGFQSDRSYWFRVTWTDQNSVSAPVSGASRFDTGLLSTGAWGSAVYIGGSSSGNSANNLFRTNFNVGSGQIVRARAYVVGLGLYHLYLNGGKVSTHALAPAWTQYQKRILYVAHDVTSVLQSGANAVGVMLGTGWRDDGTYPNLDHDTAPTDTSRQALKLIITVDYGQIGNTSTVVVSNNAWKTVAGPVTSDSIYNGETYDARREQNGWTTSSFDASSWSAAATISGPPGQLSSQVHPGIEAMVHLNPIAVTTPQSGMYVVDFGQNFQGYCRITVNNAPAGTRIQLRHAEILDDNGDGMIYTDNLRGAKATDVYITKGGASETYQPFFTYHGFRYAEVTGWPGTFQASNIVGVHFYTRIPSNGNLTFGLNEGKDNTLNNIQSMIVWGQRSNMIGYLSDCDQRDERLGWMGDASLSAETYSHNFLMGAFNQNILRNMKDEQNSDGSVPDVVPFYRYGSRPADPAWGSAYPQTLWTTWKFWGDADSVEKHYDGIKAWLNMLQSKTSNVGNMYSYYGDWVPPPPAPKCSGSLVSAFSYISNVQQAAQLATFLGRTSDATQWNQLAATLSTQYNTAFFKSSSNSYDNGVQTAYAFAFRLGVVPQANYNSVLNNFLNDIVSGHNTHLTTGIVGMKALFQTLGYIGRTDIALNLALQVDYPSHGWMNVNNMEPATTVWELFDAPEEGPGMNSRNHHMYSSIGQALVEHFVGVSQTAESYGFSHIVFHPGVLHYISRVQYAAEGGNFTATWSRDGGVQCGKVAEGRTLRLSCGANGGTITAVQFASFGTPLGGCGEFGVSTCHSSNSQSIVSSACVGKQSCTVLANNSVFGGDPCFGSGKWLAAQVTCSSPSTTTASFVVPTNRVATIRFPLLTIVQSNLKEASGLVYSGGKYAPGVAGVTNAMVNTTTNTLDVSIGSGNYTFVLTGNEGTHVCGQAAENAAVNLQCSGSNVITRINFASYGNTTVQCGANTVYTVGACHAGSSKAVLERSCLGKSSCSVTASDTTFGDPCLNVVKRAIVDVICGTN